MESNDIKRLSRLAAILTILQTKKIVTSLTLAQKFDVSVRTIYRDIKALEQAGVPIIAEERKGYTLMEGYRIPPVMFTESEANALITIEQLVQKNSDSSLIKEYTDAINKIKAVLLYSTKNKAELLSKRIAISPSIPNKNTSNSLALIQNALTDFKVLKITYKSAQNNNTTIRNIEPFAFYYNLQENWLVIAFCLLRNDYRMFRLDRILKIEPLEISFEPHELTLKDFLDTKEKNFSMPDIPLS
ncbi:putative DNA-binding transcriptional regulator YafY [Flavobacterium chryseum]|uniref:helix-turn-helix transcriptional regulator n=1 Tax=Flavobacterium sp. P3160 TaxID=2512113 RepID=UPI001061B6A5|nr:YafY family protein [Flavobacterium sp. P3160]TDO67879.1 putative DNA-binding transcriptional regulator YafY [Flavobacterium sp. P3160]